MQIMDRLQKIDRQFTSEMKFVRFTMKVLWPIYRNLVKNKLSERCSVCTVSSIYTPLISGICTECHKGDEISPKPVDSDQAHELHKLFMSTKGKGAYDALVFFSGGKDSIYMIKTLRSKYPELRLVAFTVDNGFNSPISEGNISKVCRQYEIEHLQIRAPQIFNKLYRFGFENFSSKGFFATDILGGELIQDLGRNVAAQMKIPLMVIGYTPQQISNINSECDGYDLYDETRAIRKDCQKFTRIQYCGIDLKGTFDESEMHYWWDFSRYEEDVPTMIFPFCAWGYDKEAIIKEVDKSSSSVETDPLLTNHLYCNLGIHLDYQILGYCSIEPEWATYIRKGVGDKKYNQSTWELNEYMNKYHPEKMMKNIGLNIVLEKLGMTYGDVDNIIKRSIKELQAR